MIRNFFYLIIVLNLQFPIYKTNCSQLAPDQWQANLCKANPRYAKGFKIICSQNQVNLEFNVTEQNSYRIQLVALGHRTNPNQIEIPIKKFVSLSATHISHLKKLQVLDKLVAVSRIQDINEPSLISRFQKGQLKQVGMIQSINLESIVELQPDTVFGYYSMGLENQIQQLSKLGIKMLHVNEFLESTPLAYAEWIKFFGVLFNKVDLAESKFEVMRTQYEAISRMARKNKRPKVLVNIPYGGTWFVPAGDNFMAHLIRDAGADYVFSKIPGNYNLKMSVEAVIEAGLDSDFWLNPSLHTHKASLLKSDPRFANFKAFQKNQVFNNTQALLENRTNDYFSRALSNPHLLLADLVQIFHPELLPDRKLEWFHALLD